MADRETIQALADGYKKHMDHYQQEIDDHLDEYGEKLCDYLLIRQSKRDYYKGGYDALQLLLKAK